MSLPLPKQLEDDLRSVPRYKPDKFSIEKLLESQESCLFDEVFGSQKPRRGQSSLNSRPPDDSPTSTEFTTVLTARLADTEKENRELRRQLAVATKEVIHLREERDRLNDLFEHSTDQASLIKKVKSDNAYLHKQLLEMEQFLADYGLVWVGGSKHSDGGTDHDDAEDKGQEPMDFDRFVSNIAELNARLLDEPTQVVTQVEGNLRRARLAHPEELFGHISVTLYRNGLMVKRGPFRPALSESYNSFVEDIMDGYFPSEFRNEAPDGVLIKVTDRRHDLYSAGAGGEMTEAQLLGRLPKTVVKDGHIVHVRDDIGVKLHVERSGDKDGSMAKCRSKESMLPAVSVGSAAGVAAPKGAVNSVRKADSGKRVHNITTCAHRAIDSAASASGGELLDDICTVQMKWPNGKDVFIVKMFASDIVGDLKHVLDDFLASTLRGSGCPVFSEYASDTLERMTIHSSHPPRALADSMSLRQAHLYPNGTVHVQLLSK